MARGPRDYVRVKQRSQSPERIGESRITGVYRSIFPSLAVLVHGVCRRFGHESACFQALR